MKVNVKRVATIDKFMRSNLIILEGDLPLTVACRRFLDNKTGSLLIESTTDKKFGCLTKTDIINVIGRGEDPGLVRAQDVATRPLVTIHKNQSLEDAMLKMAKNNLKRMFIVDSSETILGVISSSDILRIAPGLLEISREESLIQNTEQYHNNEKISGICDNCSNFSDYLKEMGGFTLCSECLDSRQGLDNEY